MPDGVSGVEKLRWCRRIESADTGRWHPVKRRICRADSEGIIRGAIFGVSQDMHPLWVCWIQRVGGGPPLRALLSTEPASQLES